MSWAQDIRFATRMVRKNPWFSAAIVTTLALGIGVNTTIFSLVNAVLVKPLPFPGGERLVVVQGRNLAAGRDTMPGNYPDFKEFHDHSKSFEHLEAFAPMPMNISEKGNPAERYRGALVSSGIFDMIRMQPALGHGFTAADDKAGAAPVAVLGHGIWKDRYGKDPNIAGRAIRINEKPVVIIGVMPEGFKFPNNEDVWMNLVPEGQWQKRDSNLSILAILKPGIGIPEATADLGVIAKRLEKEYPKTNANLGVKILTFHQAFNGGPIRLVFLLMLGAVGFVLLIACANVANLMLSRALTRSREVSIRAAMGASRWRIIRQLLIESVLLSVVGGLAGLFLARWGTDAFSKAVSDVGKPYWIDFTMNYVVFGYFAVISILAGVLFGLAPAWHASKVDVHDTLKEGGRTVGTVSGGWVTGALVVFQFTLAVILLSGAGLMMRSFLEHQNEHKGTPGESILTARLNLPRTRYPKAEDRLKLYERLLPRLGAMPGAGTVALVSDIPGQGGAGWKFEVEGQPPPDSAKRPAATGVVATPNFLLVMNIPLLRGRDFTDTDGLPGKEAVIVTQPFASRFWGSGDPIGKRVRLFKTDIPDPWMTVIGVIPDIRQNNPMADSDSPVVLVPYRQDSFQTMSIVMRAQSSTAALAPLLRKEVNAIDEDLPLFGVESVAVTFARMRWYLRVFGTLFLIFAILALLMAAVGIYAVMAQSTNRRTQEIGVRLAMGATVQDILKMVIGLGVRQLALGLVLGLGAAFGVCQLMAKLLFNVSPHDPVTFVTVAVVLTSAGLLACWFPARRAAQLDPMKALRYE